MKELIILTAAIITLIIISVSFLLAEAQPTHTTTTTTSTSSTITTTVLCVCSHSNRMDVVDERVVCRDYITDEIIEVLKGC